MNICKYCKCEHSNVELCKPTRRSFFFLGLSALAAVAAGKVDLIFKEEKYISEAEILAQEFDKVFKPLSGLFERDDLFYATMKDRHSLKLVSEKKIKIYF